MLSTLLLLAVGVQAQSLTPEQMSTAGELIFENAAQNPPPAPVLQPTDKEQMTEYLDKLVTATAGGRPMAANKEPASFLRLADVKNNYWRSSASFPLNGRTATVSFVVSRTQEAYMTILGDGDGAPAAWVNVKGLLDGDQTVSVNGGSFNVSLSPNIFDKLGSKIHIKGSGGSRAFSLRDLINAAFGKGFAFSIGGTEYRAFYYDDVTGSGGFGAQDASKQDIALVARDGSDFSIFLMNAEDIPANQIAVYNVASGQRAGLQMQNGRSVLALYPNP